MNHSEPSRDIPAIPALVNKRATPKFSRRTRAIFSYVSMLLGSFSIAASFNLFLLPNRIASGGVSGISVILNTLTGIMPAYTQWALNIPLFIAGVLVLGKQFGIKTAVGSIVLPLFVLLTSHWTSPTHDPLLAAIYGGLGVGLGLGLVFRGRGSTGGLDVAAQIIHRVIGIRLGLAVAMLDGLVILSAGLFISLENALYALIGLFATSKTIDIIQSGLQTSKAAFIISRHPDRVSGAILHELDRGLTRLQGVGGYTGDDRPVLLAVVGQNEVVRLKLLVRDADPDAFIIITNAAEVLGEGFHDERLL
ncbi:YitT family protein [Cohnella endophytica]|uniref:YitT family protein n=1 Tax=Cohnella endophytica TaxID=2419778 RepID=A0A494X9M6_9BACL|nr:YitT family protein [Cohnella endophytica]RKP47228.1 YitT family protein [Cohnella endophytica]